MKIKSSYIQNIQSLKFTPVITAMIRKQMIRFITTCGQNRKQILYSGWANIAECSLPIFITGPPADYLPFRSFYNIIMAKILYGVTQ